MKLIYLISQVFLAWTFLNFLAHCVVSGVEDLGGQRRYWEGEQPIFFSLYQDILFNVVSQDIALAKCPIDQDIFMMPSAHTTQYPPNSKLFCSPIQSESPANNIAPGVSKPTQKPMLV